ncbi:MAG: FlgD immunoglobulin-like domain containing protein [Fimbriimonadales bacterium]
MRKLGLTLLGVLLAWSLGTAQTYVPGPNERCGCPNNQNPVSNDYLAVSVENGVLGATLGLNGTVTWLTGCFRPDSGECTTRQAEGSIQLGTSGGSALLGDGGIALTSGYPWGVYPGGIYITFQESRGNQSRTYVWGRQGGPNVVFDRAFRGASGFYIRRTWNVDGWDTDLRIDLIQSVARISLRVRNTSTETASLAMRFAADPEVGVEEGFSQNGASRPPYVYIQGQRPVRTDVDLRGTQIPNAIEFYLSRGNLRGASRYLLRPVPGFNDQTPIDRLVVADWFFIQSTTIWEPRLFPDVFISDVAINMFVNARNFAPGQEREYVFYVTLTPVNLDVQPPLALGVETLPVIEPDSNNLANLANGGQFEVIASVSNQFFVVNREIDLNNVTVDVSLPEGLSLAPGENRVKTIASLAPGQTSSVRWRVIADPKAVGFATLRVSAQAPPAPNKSVSRTILVSATATRELKKGFQIVSVPFTTRASLDEVFDLPVTYQAKRWNPETDEYELIDTIAPGQGFWLFLPGDTTTVALNTDVLEFPTGVFNASVPVRLKKGWNQIGNPYPYPLVLGQVVLVSSSNPSQSLSFFEAAQRGIIRGVIYSWDEFDAEYKFTSDPNTPILPHRGYWIKVNEDVEFVFPPVFLPGTGFGGIITRSAEATPNRPNEWRLQIIASTSKGADSQNFIGVTSGGRSVGEIEEPPIPLPDQPVRLSLIKPGVGTALMQDLRSASAARHQFEFVVEAPAGEVVTLRMPNLNSVPAGYRLRMTDHSTARTVDLRTNPEYRFVSTGSRSRFSITVERGTRGGALITSVNVGSAGRGTSSVSISYVLAESAQTEIRIIGTDGRTVANLQRGRAASRGVNTLAWNLRDDQGRAVPPGTYQVQIEARTEDGQTSRAVRPLVLTR